MKRLLSILILSLPVFVFSQNVIQITANITADAHWTADNIYELSGTNFIYVVNGATVTIDPGTIIRGNPAALVFTRGTKINAIGTTEKPIVFTSAKPAGQRNAGDWGGLLILGNAKVNNPAGFATVEGGLDPVLGQYGGTDDADNSGVLRYARIEFAGIAFQPNNETNGLTLGGVGSQTDISYVQVSHGGDDGFEWFGGTVNGKYLVANKVLDDMFDTDFGYTGTNQFVIGISDPNIADISGSNGFEADNDATGSTNAPISQSVFTNVTIVGPKIDSATTINNNYKRGMHLRRSTRESVRNSIITGFPTAVRIESGNSENSFLTTLEMKIRNNIFTGFTTFMDSTSMNSPIIRDSILATNRTVANLSSVSLNNPAASVPDLLPKTGSPALTGANFSNMPAVAQTTTYVGAMGTSDWSKCWCEWDANNADYDVSPVNYFKEIIDFNVNILNNQVEFSPNLVGGYSYSWDFGDGLPKDNSKNPVHTYNVSGNYDVTLVITNARGCIKTFTKSINVTLVATHQLENISQFDVFPNPNAGSFNVSIIAKKNLSSTMQLIDAYGKIISSKNIDLTSGENIIPFIHLYSSTKGYYSIRIITKDGLITKLVLVI